VMNAANEVAVAQFLQDRIAFTDIYSIITQTMAHEPHVAAPTYDDYVASNAQARQYAASLIEGKR